MQKVKYPLTVEAKEAAHRLVNDWNTGKINQYFILNDYTAGADRVVNTGIGLGKLVDDYEAPPISILLELSRFQLVFLDIETIPDYSTRQARRWHVVLMQELRNAVEQGFDVSDYFLTFNAVGTIIQGNATISAP